MNTIKKFKFALIAVFGLLLINSCVKDDDWSIPPFDCADDWETNLSMEELFDMVNNAGEIVAFENETIVEGYVVTSDSTGNLFKTLSIQNSLTNPTKGLQVEMDRSNLYSYFPKGSKIKVNLKGLHVGYDRGMLKIGDLFEGDSRVGRMAEAKIDNHVKRTCDAKKFATPVEFNNIQEMLNNGVFNTLATIHNIQFDDSVIGENYAIPDETINRLMIDNEGNTVELRNSGFASFANDPLPEGSGSITVLISGFDANNNGTVSPNEYQLYISSLEDINFDQPRFGDDGGDPDPTEVEYLDCLNEGFEAYGVDNENFPNYENLPVTGGRKWRITEFQGNKYIQVSAYNAGGTVVSYFVVPVDFSNADSFSFKTKDGFYNGDPLKIYYSTDYVPGGNINEATLSNITSSFNISSGHEDGYGDNYVDSGSYDLSSLSGEGVIIFAYEGSGSGILTTMQIDDIRIVNNDAPDCGEPDDPGDPGDNGDDPSDPTENAKPLFSGYDFENWNDFLNGLNSFGLQSYATQSTGTGLNGSASLHISTNSSTTNGNDYVFTSKAIGDYDSAPTKLHFYMKGNSSKSVSLNVYKTDGSYYTFNLETLSSSSIIELAENNQYTGSINTGGEWVLVELNLNGLSNLNLGSSGDIFALKIGKNADYDLHVDEFTIE